MLILTNAQNQLEKMAALPQGVAVFPLQVPNAVAQDCRAVCDFLQCFSSVLFPPPNTPPTITAENLLEVRYLTS